MNSRSLFATTKSLRKAIRELKRVGLKDSKIRSRYAEYFVAGKLVRKGHSVQLLDEREETTADIYLPDAEKGVEVKSGCAHEDGFAYASFGVGNQIKKKKFDYCVFVTFGRSGNEDPKNIFVFTRRELKEVATIKGRHALAAHTDTNPCLLIYSPRLKEYNHYCKTNRIKPFGIERQLAKTPSKFRNAWSKIK